MTTASDIGQIVSTYRNRRLGLEGEERDPMAADNEIWEALREAPELREKYIPLFALGEEGLAYDPFGINFYQLFESQPKPHQSSQQVVRPRDMASGAFHLVERLEQQKNLKGGKWRQDRTKVPGVTSVLDLIEEKEFYALTFKEDSTGHLKRRYKSRVAFADSKASNATPQQR